MLIMLLQRLMKMTWHNSNEDYLGYQMSKGEEKEFFYAICDKIIANPRHYLNHLDEFDVVRLSINKQVYGWKKVKNTKVYKAP